ncbi:patatin-like phospholipase family protein [Salinibacter altiplanensis]|uniref:patatin-like phospholipase family protein n=1 Tax=Salinibacter altiplanensis TaxID=1803181 RepID=UPI000C9F6B0A|nr:patatin-like phospholipase family protein [Salinibacter altiplanensis]
MPSSPSGSSTLGLACAGGVIEGALYEIGALCALDEAIAGCRLHDLDIYVGVSSGSLIGSMLASNVSARTLSRAAVSESADPSLHLAPEVLFRPAVNEYAGRLLRMPGAVFSSLRHYLLHPGDLSVLELLATVGPLVPTGLFSNAALERFLAEALSANGRTNDFRRLKRKLYVVAMHLDSADVTVFGEPGHDHVPISSAIQASTALPGLYTPVEIDGQHYIDGVARRTVHASVGLDAGADLLFCVNPIVPINMQLKRHATRLLDRQARGQGASLAHRGLPTVLSQTFRAIVDSRKQTGFKKYEHTHPEADLILIEPECDDTRLFFSNGFGFQNRRDICEHAYQATRSHLRTRAGELQTILERHGLWLRQDVLDAPHTLYDTRPSTYNDGPQGSSSSMTEVLRKTDDVLTRLDVLLDRLHDRTAEPDRSSSERS